METAEGGALMDGMYLGIVVVWEMGNGVELGTLIVREVEGQSGAGVSGGRGNGYVHGSGIS